MPEVVAARPSMRLTTVWTGSQSEAFELQEIVARYCNCATDPECSAHQLLTDQRAINGLLFARSIRDRLVSQEQSR